MQNVREKESERGINLQVNTALDFKLILVVWISCLLYGVFSYVYCLAFIS